MGDKDIFVKRVDFDINGKDDSDPKTPLNDLHVNSDTEKLTDSVKATQSFFVKFLIFIDKYGIKAAFSHLGLLFALGLFCYGGGYVFVVLEKPGIDQNENELRNNATATRQDFLKTIMEAHNQSTHFDFDEEYLNEQLTLYEEIAHEAVGIGLKLTTDANGTTFQSQEEKWTILQAVFFASTVCTTIGYGNIAPVTFEGRLFCILFAIIGIPFTLTVIADYGNLFANIVSFLAKKIKSLNNKCRSNKDGPRKKLKGKKLLYALGAVVFLAIYLSCGAWAFHKFEEWSFFDGFYFCFITVTTVGFGDLVPSDYLMLIATLYILIGLALTSTIIELVRREYVRTWQKMQQMRLGRFADSLKKLGEGHTQMDVSQIQQMLALMSRKDKKLKDDESIAEFLEKVQNADKPKIVQIIIYETSV